MTMFHCTRCDCICDANNPCGCAARAEDDRDLSLVEYSDNTSYVTKLKEAWLMGLPVSAMVYSGA